MIEPKKFSSVKDPARITAPYSCIEIMFKRENMLLAHETFHSGIVPHFLHSRRDQTTTEMEGYHPALPEEKLNWKGKNTPWL